MKPTFMARIRGFTVSMAEWLSDGCPLRDPDETKELFTEHCLNCPSYISGTLDDVPGGTCGECGCFVSPDPTAIFNKINKPHHGCPLKKWAPVVDVPGNENQ